MSISDMSNKAPSCSTHNTRWMSEVRTRGGVGSTSKFPKGHKGVEVASRPVPLCTYIAGGVSA